MNRNNFVIHVALAIVLILVAAFFGQLNRWRKQWKNEMRIVPVEEKTRPQTPEQIAIAEKVQAAQGWGAWPACTAALGLS